ncbi:MAG: HRDC domain-containing protein, partial [Bacteroidales bacterium]|nr:HRDC domain-containing protein [Bacteroidales bacterium]
LKVWRNEYAQKIGFPPYIIASNNQLEEIATTKPISKKELQMIKGFGAKKIDQFGNFIILIIKNDKQNG